MLTIEKIILVEAVKQPTDKKNIPNRFFLQVRPNEKQAMVIEAPQYIYDTLKNIVLDSKMSHIIITKTFGNEKTTSYEKR